MYGLVVKEDQMAILTSDALVKLLLTRFVDPDESAYFDKAFLCSISANLCFHIQYDE